MERAATATKSITPWPSWDTVKEEAGASVAPAWCVKKATDDPKGAPEASGSGGPMSEATVAPRVLHTVPNPRIVYPWLKADQEMKFPPELYGSLCTNAQIQEFKNKYVLNGRYVRWDLLLVDTMRNFPKEAHDQALMTDDGTAGGHPRRSPT